MIGRKTEWISATVFVVLLAPWVRAADGDRPADHAVLPPGPTDHGRRTTDNADGGVMRPTQRGLRLTPRMAQAFAAYYVADEMKTVVPVTPEQESRLVESLSRRMMALVRTHEKDIRDGIESGMAMLLATDDHFDATTGKEFAERTRHMIPLMREFLKAVGDEARPVLPPEQFDIFQRKLGREGQEIDRLERKMGRWAAGGATPREHVDHFEPADGPEPPRDERELRYRRTLGQRRSAERDLSWIGPTFWERFLAGAKRFFEFDAKQAAEGDRLLAEYRGKAEAIMTAEWRERVIRNRMRAHARYSLGTMPIAPWMHQLDRSYQKDIAPVEALGREFREKVFSLATAEQRDAARARIQEAAQKAGVNLGEADARILRLQP
jgi:hypothetical protein